MHTCISKIKQHMHRSLVPSSTSTLFKQPCLRRRAGKRLGFPSYKVNSRKIVTMIKPVELRTSSFLDSDHEVGWQYPRSNTHSCETRNSTAGNNAHAFSQSFSAPASYGCVMQTQNDTAECSPDRQIRSGGLVVSNDVAVHVTHSSRKFGASRG